MSREGFLTYYTLKVLSLNNAQLVVLCGQSNHIYQ